MDVLEKLPKEVRDYLHAFDRQLLFEVARNRFEAITIVNKRKRRVFKFVRRSQRLLKAIDAEIKILRLIARKKIVAPRVLRRIVLTKYVLVVYEYISGDVSTKNVSPARVKALANFHRKLHSAFSTVPANIKVSWNSKRILKPIFQRRNQTEFSIEMIQFARKTGDHLLPYEKRRTGISLIHSDSHFSNIVFDKGTAILIDYAEAGYASVFFEIGVVVHALLFQPTFRRPELIKAYLYTYFQRRILTQEETLLVELHVRLRCIEAATWHLLESASDQVKNWEENRKWIASCFRKAETFRLKRYLEC